ncbi:MAG: T9SS type A sorting domain-containing protein, partial [Flavobacteriaceae bacterium]|nr:T9SS type A sorting domain-containing protein [Flavobacteriaceae bacterium]
IGLSAPGQFEISLSQNSGYGASLNLTPVSGSVATTVVYVRYNPSAAGSHNGNINCSSTGATSVAVAVNGTTGSVSPVIITSISALNTFTTTAGTPSSSLSFTVTGNDLTANLVVTAPTSFEVSLSQSSGFGSTVSFSPSSGKVNNGTVYVRYNPSAAGSHGGNVVCSSTGATSQNVAVSGNSTGNPIPAIVASVSSLNVFSTSTSTPSNSQSFTVSGTDLTANLTVTAPSSFEVSLTSGSGFGSSVSFTPTSGKVTNATVYVRYNPSVAGPHSGNVVCSSNGATNQNVLVSGTTSGTVSPVITVSTNSLVAFSTQVGTPSSTQLFNVLGTDLNGLLVVSAPADFQVSLSSGSGFGGSVTFSPSGGKVNNGNVYVRYNPTTSGSHNGNVSCAAAGATTQDVSVSGTATVPAGPVVTATNISNAFTTTVGTPSAPQAMAVSGSNLTADVSVTVPTHFEISLNVGTGFTNSLTLTKSGSSVSTTIIYVRYNPAGAGSHSGSVNVVSQGANTQNVNVSGTAAPIGIKDAEVELLKVYPNPATDRLNIVSNCQGSIVAEVLSADGKIVSSEKAIGNSISVSGLAPGIYLLKLSNSNGEILVSRFVKH